jgi:hypothetical protein
MNPGWRCDHYPQEFDCRIFLDAEGGQNCPGETNAIAL